MHQKDSFFHPLTLSQRRGFLTHRCARMRACSLDRRAHMRACSLYMRTQMRACSLHRRPHECTCPSYRRAHERACPAHRHALVRVCPPHRRAPRERLKFPLTCTYVRLLCGQARTYACLPLNLPRMRAHIL
jgi:hypothetical protein